MAALTGAAFLLVFLRAWQQQNVIHGRYGSAFFTSYALAIADVVVILGAVREGLDVILFIGTGGAFGVVSAMWLHKRVRKCS